LLIVSVHSYMPTDVYDYTPQAVTCGPSGPRYDWWTLLKMCKQGCTWMPNGDMDTHLEGYGFVSHTNLHGSKGGPKIAILFEWTLANHPAKGGWYLKFLGAKYWQTEIDTFAAVSHTQSNLPDIG